MLSGRIIDQNIEASEFAHRVGDQLPAKILVTNVARKRDRLAPGLTYQLHHLDGVRFFGG